MIPCGRGSLDSNYFQAYFSVHSTSLPWTVLNSQLICKKLVMVHYELMEPTYHWHTSLCTRLGTTCIKITIFNERITVSILWGMAVYIRWSTRRGPEWSKVRLWWYPRCTTLAQMVRKYISLCPGHLNQMLADKPPKKIDILHTWIIAAADCSLSVVAPWFMGWGNRCCCGGSGIAGG